MVNKEEKVSMRGFRDYKRRVKGPDECLGAPLIDNNFGLPGNVSIELLELLEVKGIH